MKLDRHFQVNLYMLIFLHLFIKVEFCLGTFSEYSGAEYWGREDRDSDWVTATQHRARPVSVHLHHCNM